MRLSARVSSPRSSLDTDGTPRTRSGSNGREILLERAAAALNDYYKADEEYDSFEKEYTRALSELDHRERLILEIIYIDNRGRPIDERLNGVYKWTGLKRVQIPAAERQAEKHLAEILKRQGVEIED